MFNSMGPSLADIAAVTNNDRNNGGFGDGNGWWVLIILFALFGGWGNNGYGNGGGAAMQGALTRGDLCMDMNFNDLQGAVRSISDGVNVGFSNLNSTICHQQYDTANLINGVQMQVANEFRGLDNAVCTLGYNTQAGFNALSTQQAQCCCDQKAEAAQTRYAMQQGFCELSNQLQNSTRDIIDNQNAQYMRQIENENQTLRLAASQEAQNQYLINTLRPFPEPAYITVNPWASQGTYGSCCGYNNGCGCCN